MPLSTDIQLGGSRPVERERRAVPVPIGGDQHLPPCELPQDSGPRHHDAPVAAVQGAVPPAQDGQVRPARRHAALGHALHAERASTDPAPEPVRAPRPRPGAREISAVAMRQLQPQGVQPGRRISPQRRAEAAQHQPQGQRGQDRRAHPEVGPRGRAGRRRRRRRGEGTGGRRRALHRGGRGDCARGWSSRSVAGSAPRAEDEASTCRQPPAAEGNLPTGSFSEGASQVNATAPAGAAGRAARAAALRAARPAPARSTGVEALQQDLGAARGSAPG